MERDLIRKLALDAGFKLKPQENGREDLNEYVYDFADALLREAKQEAYSMRDKAVIQARRGWAKQERSGSD